MSASAGAAFNVRIDGVPRRGAARPPRRLRLRDYGATPGFFLTATLLSLGAQLAPVSFVLVIMHIADGVTDTRNSATLVAQALVFLLVSVMCGVFVALRSTLIAAVAERLSLRLRAEAMQAAIRNAVTTDPADGIMVLQDIGTIESVLRSPLPVLPFEMIAAIVPVALMFYLGMGFGLLALGGILVALVFGYVLYRATRDSAQQARRQLNDANADLSGQLSHPDLVRGLGMLWASVLRWQPRYDAALGRMEDVGKRTNAIGGIEELAFIVYEMAVKTLACLMLFEHYGTLGLLMAVSIFSTQLVAPFGYMAKTWQAWAFTLEAWRRLGAALGEHAAPAIAPADPDAPPGLVIDAVRFQPPGRKDPIIGDLTLRLPPGTVATIEGANGVGKSTLLRLVLGLMPAHAGTVLLDGQDTFRCDRGEFGGRIGYLPQDVQLLEGSVFHNIGRGPGASPEGVVAAARAAGAHELIGRLPAGYQTPAGAISGLSAGQRRLIGLARALYGEPRLLVLDEPEVGLDGYARVAMRAAVRDVRERGGIVLVVTHEPGTWRGAVDLRVMLSAGGGWQVQPAEEPAAESGGQLMHAPQG